MRSGHFASSCGAIHQFQKVVVLAGAGSINCSVANKLRCSFGIGIKTQRRFHKLIHHAPFNTARHAHYSSLHLVLLEILCQVCCVGVCASTANQHQTIKVKFLASYLGPLRLILGVDSINGSSKHVQTACAPESFTQVCSELDGLLVQEAMCATNKAKDFVSKVGRHHVHQTANEVMTSRCLASAEHDANLFVCNWLTALLGGYNVQERCMNF
mmetsp:Transcript_66213/g.81024  ORF Transcript_66213/g.81024 Transcript_66213/m.81024 type:complete len:213 (-) Transcript_66213:301-939(-)